MNWEAISAIGQVLGSVAVFVTLGYLAVQVRLARGELRRSIRQGRYEAMRALYMARAGDPRLLGLIGRVNESLSDGGALPQFNREIAVAAGIPLEDAAAVYNEHVAWWSYRVQVIPYLDELPTEDREEFDETTRMFYSSPYGRRWLQSSRAFLNRQAVQYIEGLLAKSR
jgi:hypothetical protein